MVTIVLKQGDSVRVEVADGDGSFEIAYTTTEFTVTAEMPGSHVGAAGIIHREVFAGCTCDGYGMTDGIFDPKCPEHGEFGHAGVVEA